MNSWPLRPSRRSGMAKNLKSQIQSARDASVIQPRITTALVGQDHAEQTLRRAYDSGRLAHGWLLHGPRGIGKATLAYRFARFILAGGGLNLALPDRESGTLAIHDDHPVTHRIAARGHADLATVERAWDDKRKRLRDEIVVSDVRTLSTFFALTPAEGEWRIAIIDAADDMNRNASNAVLKTLEEPPQRGLLLLVSHAPGRLLPTIRSRCRKLTLKPLSSETIVSLLADRVPDLSNEDRTVLAGLAGGSFGRALEMAGQGGVDVFRDLVAALKPLPDLDLALLHQLGDRLARRGSETGFRLFTELLIWWIARFIRHTASKTELVPFIAGEGDLARRLAACCNLEQWADVWEKVVGFLARAEAMNLDRKQVILIIFQALSDTARGRLATVPE